MTFHVKSRSRGQKPGDFSVVNFDSIAEMVQIYRSCCGSRLQSPSGLLAKKTAGILRLQLPAPHLGSHDCSVLLLNKNFETLVVGKLPVSAQDFRLFAFNGKVLVTAVDDRGNRDNGQEYSTRVFELGLNFMRHVDNETHQCPRMLNVVLQQFQHHGVSDYNSKTSQPRFFGKNIGLVSNKEDGELQILWRLTNPVTMKNWTSETNLETDTTSTALKNNGSPLYLPEHDAYLTFGHSYWSGRVEFNQTMGHHVRDYVHRIVLFDANPPYKWLRASNPFCFPAVSTLSQDLHPAAKEEWCEIIQFIMSWFREGDDIIITHDA